ncbi:MAG TPA: UDP-2,3-diacylglucosamine diphosphatase [Cytophagales bacterium]|nr:UDP-2,3-diacylglucosamine diphosphatase [Cytophagales bacterium]
MHSLEINLDVNKKIYFASDFHLGAPNALSSLERERKIIRWLDQIRHDAQTIILLGDIFDFWFEYKHVVPKGYVRIIGKFAELADAGIQLIFFTGNHDMWMFDYLPSQFKVQIYRTPQTLLCSGKKFFLHHGDGLGSYDKKYKVMKLFFNSKICQRLFAFLHPYIGFTIATTWSKESRIANHENDEIFLGEDEWLWQYVKKLHHTQYHDYYIMGHRHFFMTLPVGDSGTYINLGEWVKNSNYASFNGFAVETSVFEPTNTPAYAP